VAAGVGAGEASAVVAGDESFSEMAGRGERGNLTTTHTTLRKRPLEYFLLEGTILLWMACGRISVTDHQEHLFLVELDKTWEKDMLSRDEGGIIHPEDRLQKVKGFICILNNMGYRITVPPAGPAELGSGTRRATTRKKGWKHRHHR